MQTPFFLLKSVAAGLFCIALASCSTPPEKPYSPPTQPPIQPPPQQTQAPQQQQQSSQASGGQTQTEPSEQQSAAQTQPADSAPGPQPAEAAAAAAEPPAAGPDVEITDIPLDEDGNPIVAPASQQSTASSNAATSPSQQSGGGGGAPTPPGGRDPASIGSRGNETPVGGDLVGPVNAGATTAAERSASLEQDLKAKLAKFDELMRKAREDAEQERTTGGGGTAATNQGGGYAGATAGRGGREDREQTGEGGRAESSSGLGHTPDETGTGRAGTYRQATGPIPNDVPDARDDDIVARQLREAATRESDPVLREKLWEEYRKYKSGTGR